MLVVCKEWYAWINTQPVGPARIHVVGSIEVGNPGVEVHLTKRSTKEPTTLTLDISLYQKPGNWIQRVTCAPANYDEVLPGKPQAYTAIHIFHGADLIAKIESIDVMS